MGAGLSAKGSANRGQARFHNAGSVTLKNNERQREFAFVGN